LMAILSYGFAFSITDRALDYFIYWSIRLSLI
jgi:hypothetical protein